MKQFTNLLEATTYHKKCYVCGGRLICPYQIEFDINKPTVFKWNLSENIDSETDDWITIDPLSNRICYLEQTKYESGDFIYGADGQLVDFIGKKSKTYKIYKGTLYESLHFDCGECRQFGYTLQIIINATKMKLDGIFLNSETIAYKKSQNLHQVKNIYSTNKTEYNLYFEYKEKSKGFWTWEKDKSIIMPLIDLNLQDPSETVDRIRKLNLFS